MRQTQALQVLRLAMALRASTTGLTLADMKELLEVDERRVYRVRDAVAELFPDLTVELRDDRRKYWRLPAGQVDKLVAYSAEELAALETAGNILTSNGFGEIATQLQTLGEKLRAALPPPVGRRLDPDVEALLEAESFALRPGPRPQRNPKVLDAIRTAVKAGCALTVRYRYRGQRGHNEPVVSQLLLQPYGILFGSRHYLVAHRPADPTDEAARQAEGRPFLRLFSLPEIEDAEVLVDQPFARDPSVSLQGFTEQSFGIFQEAPRDIVWRFTGPAVRDASSFVFHPSQVLEEQPDGSLIVRFRAGGLREMCWHLFTWGKFVEVLAPQELRELYKCALDEGGAPPPVQASDDPQADLFEDLY